MVTSLGERGSGLTSEIWWSPSHPFKSGLTGESAKQLTDAYTDATKRPWTQPIGFKHALFEVAIDVLKRTKDIGDPKSIRDAIAATDYHSIVGPVKWSGQPVKNVSKTPLVAGQWQGDGKYELVVAENKTAPEIPAGGKLQPGLAVVTGPEARMTDCSQLGRHIEAVRLHRGCGRDRSFGGLDRGARYSGPERRGQDVTVRASSPARLRPDGGRVTFRGEDLTALPPEQRCRKGIARSFQVPQPFGAMTVLENLLVAASFGRGLGDSEAYRHCVATLERCALADKANRLAGSLTLLDRKRLELARALASQPTLLLLDEVAGGLVEHECAELVALIKDVRKQGVAIVWIEHIVHALVAVVDRVVVLRHGGNRFIAEGDPTQVIKSPQVAEIYMGIPTEA